MPGYEEIELYFINDTPELMGGSLRAEFATNRPGVEIYCQIVQLGGKQDCKETIFYYK